MSLYQPSNIMPSTFAGEGGGVVAAADGVKVVWQINGNSPMAAFCIDFFKNDTASTPIYSTGVLTDGCPAFGNDRRGNPVFFSYAPDLLWGDFGISDGEAYKLKITCFFEADVYRRNISETISAGNHYFPLGNSYVGFSLAEDAEVGGRLLYNAQSRAMAYISSDSKFVPISVTVLDSVPAGGKLTFTAARDYQYVTQYSDSAFVARTAPVLSLAEHPAAVSNVSFSFSAVYSQAQEDAIDRVQWQFAAKENGQYEMIDDTGWVNTGILSYDAVGLLTGNVYAVSCSVVTENGVEVSTGWCDFAAVYEQSEAKGELDVQSRDDGGVLLSWSAATVISGVAEPAEDFGTFRDGRLSLSEGSSVTWDTVDGEPLDIPSPFTVGWRGRFEDISPYLSSLSVDALPTAKMASLPTRDQEINHFAFSPDGRFFVCNVGTRIETFLVIDGILSYRGAYSLLDVRVILGIEFTGDGKGLLIATASSDYYYKIRCYSIKGTDLVLTQNDILASESRDIGNYFTSLVCAPCRGDFVITYDSDSSKIFLNVIKDGKPTGKSFLVSSFSANASRYGSTISVSDDGQYIAISPGHYDYSKCNALVFRVERDGEGNITGLSEIFSYAMERNTANYGIALSSDSHYLAFFDGQIIFVYSVSGSEVSRLYLISASWHDPNYYGSAYSALSFFDNSHLMVFRPSVGFELYDLTDTEAIYKGVFEQDTKSHVAYFVKNNMTSLMFCCATYQKGWSYGSSVYCDQPRLYRFKDDTFQYLGDIDDFPMYETSAFTISHSPDGSLAVVGGYFKGYAALFSVQDGVYTLIGAVTRDGEALNGLVSCAAWSDDGAYLVLGGYFSGSAAVFSVADGALTYLCDVTRGGEALDGMVLAASIRGGRMLLGGMFSGGVSDFVIGDGTVTWNADLVRGERVFDKAVYAVALSDGAALVGGGFGGSAALFSVNGGDYSYCSDLAVDGKVLDGITFAVDFVASEDMAVICGEYGAYLLMLSEGSVASSVSLGGTDGGFRSAAVSAGGEWIFCGGAVGLLYSRNGERVGLVHRYDGDTVFRAANLAGDVLATAGTSTQGAVAIYRVADTYAALLSCGNVLIEEKRRWLSVFGVSEPLPLAAKGAMVSVSHDKIRFAFFDGDGLISCVVHDNPSVMASASSVVIAGEQICDWVYASAGEYDFSEVGYAPKRTVDTYLFADFEDGDLEAGTSSAGAVRNSVYRMTDGSGRAKLLYDVPTSINTMKDYGAASLTGYNYELFYVTSDAVDDTYSAPILSKDVRLRFAAYFLYEAEQDEEYPNVYHVVNVWRFGNNIEAGGISNNNQPGWLTNFTPYRLRQPSSQMGKSGTLSALLSNASGGAYSDTADMMERLYAASASDNTFFLKDMKGNLYMVAISAPITQTVGTKSHLQPVTVTVPWEEVGDAADVALIQLPTDEAWMNDVDMVSDVRLDVDVSTGELSATYPDGYRGTVFALRDNVLETEVPDGLNSPTVTLKDGQVVAKG